MAKILVTGGAGFMGRWVSKHLVFKGHRVWIMDNLANCTENNIHEFRHQLAGFTIGDIKDKELLDELFKNNFDQCIHLAAAINVQESINNPQKCFNDNIVGTFNVLNECKKHNTKIVFISSALIYKSAKEDQPINEDWPLNPSCLYTTSKIFGENLVMSFYRTYKLPCVILRPFSIYGPWQRSDSEGGVISIFINRKLKNQPIQVYGDGQQSRDFFYIEDCAEFIEKAAFSEKTVGEILNAGSGQEVKIIDLAKKIANKKTKIDFIKHLHPHAEIMSMRADSAKAERILGWKPKTSLEEGLSKTAQWLEQQACNTKLNDR